MKSSIERFNDYFIPDKSGCWLWTRSKDKDGYGCFEADGFHRAHRWSYWKHQGAIPHGMIVMHSCDNPSCVNPDHLSLGTNKLNTRDMVDKGRNHTGQDHGMAKLSAKQVLAIFNDRRTQAEIAKDYGITQPNVGWIKSGYTWSSVTGKTYHKRKSLIDPDNVRAIYTSSEPTAYWTHRLGVSDSAVRAIRLGTNGARYTAGLTRSA